ncbi:conserved hypothetical protein [Candidatus Zixiibacteriota bacterium]|nr:conserved hypothetical protein [candidate division Zixibacteria bacterium]
MPAGMAVANRGLGLIHYGKLLYDPGHTQTLQQKAYHFLKEGYGLGLESGAIELVKKWLAEVECFYGHKSLNAKVDLDSYPIGDSDAEQAYRRWCLAECLYLNPLNDIGPHTIAARDIFHLPPLVTPIDVGPGYHGLFNQLKQEFIAARSLFYEGRQADGETCYSDHDMFLYDTLDYPRYGLAVERQRQAFRMAYSILDKIAYYINEYYCVGLNQNKVFLRSVWFASSGPKKGQLLPVFADRENWPLRGLYFLSRDLYQLEVEHREVLDPMAKGLSDLRNSLEHRYLKIHDIVPPSATERVQLPSHLIDELAHSIYLDEFREKSLHLLRLARAALIYLSLSIRQEEERKQTSRTSPMAPTALALWKPGS